MDRLGKMARSHIAHILNVWPRRGDWDGLRLTRALLIERARTARLRKLVRLYEEKAPADVVDRVESLMEVPS